MGHWDGDVSLQFEIIPVDHLGNELIRFGIKVDFMGIGNREPAKADFAEGFAGGESDR